MGNSLIFAVCALVYVKSESRFDKWGPGGGKYLPKVPGLIQTLHLSLTGREKTQ